MSQKTYGSKKYTGYGLDHRDTLSTVDDKRSAFDAYYIQNIKQNKRELSSIESSLRDGVASSSGRVRKKKYVKRLVKEIEKRCRDSSSKSVCLTPDKSIHVNKETPDPFDLLLNSTPKTIHEKNTPDHFDMLLNESTQESVCLTPDKSIHVNKETPDPFDLLLNSSPKTIHEKNTPDHFDMLLNESTQESVCLTPDKSIHVNKETPDPFDLLLNSSPKTIHEKNTPDHFDMLLNESTQESVCLTPDKSIHVNKETPDPFDLLLNSSPKTIHEKNTPDHFDMLLNKSPQESVCLTPDKSIHVNKETPDPFDLLLNSSTKSIHEKNAPDPVDKLLNSLLTLTCTKKDNEGPFDKQLVERVTVCKKANTRKKCRPKKLSAPTTSESKKENLGASNGGPLNVTDILSHELLIEEETKYSPKLEDPIQKMLKNLPLWNELTKVDKTNESITKVLNKNQLNCNSTLLTPQHSTPFKNKHHRKSIYQFSPIHVVEINDASANARKDEEFNDLMDLNQSVVYVTKRLKNNSKNKNNNSSNKKDSHHSSALFSSVEVKSLCQTSTATDKTSKTDIETSEIEPFLGFNFNENSSIVNPASSEKQPKTNNYGSDNESNGNYPKKMTTDPHYLSKYFQKESSPKIGNHEFYSSQVGLSNVMIKPLNKQHSKEIDIFSIDLTETSEPSIGSDDDQNYSNICDDSERKSDLSQNFKSDNDKPDVSVDISNNTGVHETYLKENDDESQYDTCNSDQSSFADDSNEFQNEPFENLSSSVFAKYDNNATNNKSNKKSVDEFNSSSIETGNESIEGESNNFHKQQSDYLNTESNMISDDNCGSEKAINNMEDNDNNTSIDYEDRCFVTTRRRHYTEAVKNESTVLDESLASMSSSECDKTVIRREINTSQDVTTNNQQVNENELNADDKYEKNDKFATPDPGYQHIAKECRISLFKTNKSPKLATELPDEGVDSKPAIVLQPGKKWERSLSIYRRMTLLCDNNDQSILDDQEMITKGRKFRQTVINMMNMQPDCKETLHNDSTQSNRNTIVCRPSRSTIRLVKDTSSSRLSVCSTSTDPHELSFLEDCDDTVIELSKLSLEDHDDDVTNADKLNEQSCIAAAAQDYVLRRCNQTDLRPFDECYPNTVLKNCRKIGEGVYGEVYLWRAPDGVARVMKVVPVAGTLRVNGEPQKHFHEIISEIVIAMELSALRAPIADIECHFDEGKEADQLDLHSVENATDVFNQVLAVRCVYGSYPARLLDLWELYDETTGSENDNPKALPPHQRYVVLELANAGQDLESYHFNSAEQAHALLLQVAFGLAVGEEAVQLEHRDLHWGNVLIAPTEQQHATFALRGRTHRVRRRGVRATVIDYSLSRMSVRAGGDACALYNDLATDQSLFGAAGDYQFDVYRLMRERLNNDWKKFEPYTNVLWLHYTVDKMLTKVHYKRVNTKLHRQYMGKLRVIRNKLLSYQSAVDFVLDHN